MKSPRTASPAPSDLDRLIGMVGDVSDMTGAYSDDRIVILMAYVYEMMRLDSGDMA